MPTASPSAGSGDVPVPPGGDQANVEMVLENQRFETDSYHTVLETYANALALADEESGTPLTATCPAAVKLKDSPDASTMVGPTVVTTVSFGDGGKVTAKPPEVAEIALLLASRTETVFDAPALNDGLIKLNVAVPGAPLSENPEGSGCQPQVLSSYCRTRAERALSTVPPTANGVP